MLRRGLATQQQRGAAVVQSNPPPRRGRLQQPAGGWRGGPTVDRCDQSKRIRLNRRFPALEDVQLRDCCFSEVVLNAELTPSVRSLVVENLNDVALQLACPKMHQMRLLYYGGPRTGRSTSARSWTRRCGRPPS